MRVSLVDLEALNATVSLPGAIVPKTVVSSVIVMPILVPGQLKCLFQLVLIKLHFVFL